MKLRLGILAGLVAAFAGCAHDEPKPQRPSTPGLGSEIFGVLCTRVGAQALREDMTGASYRGICHGSSVTVDTSQLPPEADALVRDRAIAKLEEMARHRAALIAALDVVFPDDEVVGKDLQAEDPTASCKPVSGVPRREQLRGLLNRLLPVEGNDTLPDSSRSLARAIEPLLKPESALVRTNMARLAARRGYMPPDLAAGLLGTVFTAPRLRDMLGATTTLFSPGGKGHDQLTAFVDLTIKDLDEPTKSFEPYTVSKEGKLSRPLTTLELLQKVSLAEDPAFSNGPPLYVVRRDQRGMAVVARGKNGALPAPFVDDNQDGLPDIDKLGRFVTTDKEKVADPFVGDTRSPVYEYIDARSTSASAFLRHLTVLADPDGGNEALLTSLEGLEPLLKEKEALLDVVHAATQIAADPATDELLAISGELLKKEPQVMARVVGSLLDAKEILDRHPEASFPRELTDDLLVVLRKIAEEPGLLADVLGSIADPRSQKLAVALPPLLTFRDQLTYDPTNLNGPPRNLSTGKVEGPKTPVDRNAPNSGWNRSLLQRFLQIVHDGSGVTMCNKKDGFMRIAGKSDTGGYYDGTLPIFCGAGDYDQFACMPDLTTECSLLKVEDVSIFYLQAIAGKGVLHVRDVSALDNIEIEAVKHSTGLTAFWDWKKGEELRPKPEFLNRLVFFDARNEGKRINDPNYRTGFTIRDLQGDVVPTAACARRGPVPDPAPVGESDRAPDGMIRGLRTCQNGQYIHQRDANTIFALEYNSGYEALAPLAEVFVNRKKEHLLVELLDVLYKHWDVAGSALAKSEPALAEIVANTDVVGALNALGQANLKINANPVLAKGIGGLIENSAADRRGAPKTLFELLRSALDAQEAVVARDPKLQKKWLTARSHIVDEFLAVNGRGPEAKFADPGIPQLAPSLVGLVRQQREAKCRNDGCSAFRKEFVADLSETLNSPLTKATLDLVDAILADRPMRRELGRMTSYLTRQSTPLGSAGGAASASSMPFVTSRGPGVLDQSVAALVDGVGALGNMREIQGTYPAMQSLLRELDPQLEFLKRLNQRVYDTNGKELCSEELDPDGVIQHALARMATPIDVEGQPRRTALQIILDAIADVNRIDPAHDTPLAGDDYKSVFENIHDLLTDPTGGLEQLYASVREATAQ